MCCGFIALVVVLCRHFFSISHANSGVRKVERWLIKESEGQKQHETDFFFFFSSKWFVDFYRCPYGFQILRCYRLESENFLLATCK